MSQESSTQNKYRLDAKAKTKRIAAIAGIVLLGGGATSIAGCGEDNETSVSESNRANVGVSDGGSITAAPGIIIRESYSINTPDAPQPYKILLDPSRASSELTEAFQENPCDAVLGRYTGKIACTVDGNAALLHKLPGEYNK
jgi:hypothetical protein